MKNLKRALSMALATVMLMSMAAIGTSAASFDDVAAEHNIEAIEMMKATGIMVGDEKGEFNPDQKVTRNEMAVIICKMLDLDAEDFEGVELPFTDVPAWAAPYVAACYAEGIVAGTSATTYGGAQGVKAVEAALMVMKTLGYFQFQADYGTNWSFETAKKAGDLELFEDIAAGLQTALDRNDVAQLVLNALETEMVETDGNGGTTIEGNGFTITTGGNVKYEGTGESLLEYLFDDRFEKDENAKTELGLPAIEWYDNDEKETVVTIADEADEVLVATEDTTVLELFQDEVDEDAEAADFNKADEAVAAGDVVYYYEKDDTYKSYTVTYSLIQIDDITKLDAEDDEDAIEDGHKYNVEFTTLAGADVLDELYDGDFADFDYEEDDYVLVAYGKDGKDTVIAASELAETIEGTIKGTKGDDVKVDGKYYENASAKALGYNDEFVGVLDKAGRIIFAKDVEAATSDNYAYIYNLVESEDDEKNDDGVTSTEKTYTAYLLLADGTKAKYVVEEDTVGTIAQGDVIAYSINKDDELEKEKAEADIKNLGIVDLSKDAKYVTIDGKRVYADSKTEFVFFNWEKSKLETSTATGIKNVKIDDQSVIAVYDDNDLLFAFVGGEDQGIESDAEYAIMVEYLGYTENDDDEPQYAYSVMVGTEEQELVFETKQSLNTGDFFAYIVDGDYAEVLAADDADNELESGKVAYAGEDWIDMNGTEYTYDDADIYNVTITTEKGDTTVSVKAADADALVAEADKDAEKQLDVYYVANSDDEIEFAYIVKYRNK